MSSSSTSFAVSDCSFLVLGATGVIGDAIMKRAAEKKISITGISRRSNEKESQLSSCLYISADVASTSSIRSLAQQQSVIRTTVLVYTVFQDDDANLSSEAQKAAKECPGGLNGFLFENVLRFLVPMLPRLERIVLIEGVKAYGVHLGPFKTPAKEDDPRPFDNIFYFYQEDLLKRYVESNEAKHKLSFTVLRPDAVCGPTSGFPMNLALGVAVYAAICKELNLPLRYPGSPLGFSTLSQVTDSVLLADVILWSGLSPRCANQIINVTNGDIFRWENLWPKIANYFQIPSGSPQKISLAKQMPTFSSKWASLIEKHRLKNTSIERIVSWNFVDWLLNCEYDVISNVTKLRKLGFHEVVDTEEMFLKIIKQFQENGTLPNYGSSL